MMTVLLQSRLVRARVSPRQAAPPLPTAPGAITRATVLRVVAEIARLTSSVEASGLALGNIAARVQTLVALAPDGGQGGGIWLDGESLDSTHSGPGVTLVLLDPSGRVKHSHTYNTVAGLSASQLLELDVQRYARRLDLAIGVTSGPYLNQLGAEGRTALTRLGASALWQSPRPPGAAAFISVVSETTTAPGVAGLVSVVPADRNGQPAVLPFAWAVYSPDRRRFVVGGASGSLSAQPLVQFGRTRRGA